MEWTSGYVAEIDYTYGYYGELNPLRCRLPLLFGGYAVPRQFTNACELGFGQGISVNMHAAGAATQWHGNDFNPSQAAFAQDLATVSGLGAKLSDEAFAEFCMRDDLPGFDFIGLHGIWSWISDDNRRVLVDFIRRKLNVGGVLYISYNTQPGWAAMMPMRHLLTLHAATEGAKGQGLVSRIDDSLAFAEKLFAANPAYARANAAVAERFNGLKTMNRNYLAHEYFNADWHPMHFAAMADWLAPAKVAFAGSAHLLDHLAAINFTADQQKLLDGVRDPVLRETLRDFLVNQQFRRDYWVKGARKIPPVEQAEQIRAQRLLLITHPSAVEMKVKGTAGEADLQERIYAPLIEALAGFKILEFAELEQKLKPRNITYAQLVQAVLLLTGRGDVAVVQDDKSIQKARPHTDRLNKSLMLKARSSSEIAYLASPVTGGGIGVPRFQQLFLLAKAQGHKTPEAWAEFVWQIISAQGQRIAKEGKALETDAENREELLGQAKEFAVKHPGVLKALQVTD